MQSLPRADDHPTSPTLFQSDDTSYEGFRVGFQDYNGQRHVMVTCDEAESKLHSEALRMLPFDTKDVDYVDLDNDIPGVEEGTMRATITGGSSCVGMQGFGVASTTRMRRSCCCISLMLSAKMRGYYLDEKTHNRYERKRDSAA